MFCNVNSFPSTFGLHEVIPFTEWLRKEKPFCSRRNPIPFEITSQSKHTAAGGGCVPLIYPTSNLIPTLSWSARPQLAQTVSVDHSLSSGGCDCTRPYWGSTPSQSTGRWYKRSTARHVQPQPEHVIESHLNCRAAQAATH